MYKEKSMYDYVPEARTIETRAFPMWVKMESGWQQIEIPQQVITGWEPLGREVPNGKS
jgi:hypothetical protein